MPKITKEQIENATYVSIADFYKRVGLISDFNEKVKFATTYLLTHGMNGAPTDYSLEEAIHLVRAKLIDESKKLREEDRPLDMEEKIYIDENPDAVNPRALEEKDDVENQFFMANPGEYLKSKANQYAKSLGEKDAEIGTEVAFRRNCERLSKSLSAQTSRDILSKEQKGMAVLDITARMQAKYISSDLYRRAEKAARPGFFARHFGTRSLVGKNFDEVYKAFHNPKHALYGNKEALAKATNEYIDYKESKKPLEEKIAGLALEDPKVAFAKKLRDALAEQKESEGLFKSVVGAAAKKEWTEESVNQVKGIEAEENPHRIPMVLDLSDDESEYSESLDSEAELRSEIIKEEEEPSLNQ